MSWKPAIDANLIHDYEVGLSSTASSIAPDIVSFRTTKQHTHFRLNHPDVPDGKEFYIIIKSISKAGVEGLQVSRLWQCGIFNNKLSFDKITLHTNCSTV